MQSVQTQMRERDDRFGRVAEVDNHYCRSTPPQEPEGNFQKELP